MRNLLALVLLLTVSLASADESQISRLFLQQVAHDGAIVKWRGGPDSIFVSGSDITQYSEIKSQSEAGHKFAQITGLQPDTEYFYSFKSDGPVSAFRTAPVTGKSPADGNIHVWLLGDSGTETEQFGGVYPHKGEAAVVRDGYLKYRKESGASENLDLLLLLGDNAYLEGTDAQWQGSFFEIYPEILRSTATWPTIGNHEMGVGAPFDICPFRKLPACEAGPVMLYLGGISESSDPDSYDSDGDGPDPGGLPYLNIFTLPIEGEMGGEPSGTEQYYSFDYGNLHVVSLDSQLSNRDREKRNAMRDWLIKDLTANKMDWTVAIFHHPPFSKGENHDSDVEQNEIDMREAFAPVFENFGVDAVYSGHAHSYERSWYLRDHYGMSETFDASEHALLDEDGQPALGGSDSPYVRGAERKSGRTIYTVAGAGGKADSLHPCPEGQVMGCTLPDWLMHPAHRTFDQNKPGYREHGIARKGSVVLDIKERSFTSRYIDVDGVVLDEFTITRSVVADLSMSYRRLLPLEGGSNFRDMGGYVTESGKTVVRGKLFRSGAMTSLTDDDMAYLSEFGFKTVVDLRSDEEIELYPNHWARIAQINTVTGGYSFKTMLKQDDDAGESSVYSRLLRYIEPQLKDYFAAALQGQAPMVVNCSAGQDRTGVTAALMLTLLGVPEEAVIEDYLLSTDFRRPVVEQGGVDLVEAAKTNAFAAMMVDYKGSQPHPDRPNPLVTPEGKPFLSIVFDQIRSEHGSIEAYAKKVLGVDADALEDLRALYLK